MNRSPYLLNGNILICDGNLLPFFWPILSVKSIYGKDTGRPGAGDNPHTERRLYHQPVARRICLPRGCGREDTLRRIRHFHHPGNARGFRFLRILHRTGCQTCRVLFHSNKPITYNMAAGTATLADHGTVSIPVIISGATYTLSFVWSKAKSGTPGKDGADASMLDWVKEWNTGKTLINKNTVITPNCSPASRTATALFPVSPSVHSHFP